MENRLYIIFILTSLFYNHSFAQTEIAFKFNPGFGIITNVKKGEDSQIKFGYIQDYRLEITYPVVPHFEIVPAIGIQFYNFPNYFNAGEGLFIGIPAMPLKMNYIVGSMYARYHFNHFSLDLGYNGHLMFAKNIHLGKGIGIGRTAFVYPYKFSDKFQNSIQIGINNDWRNIRLGVHYDWFIDHIYDTKGFDVPGSREYRALQALHFSIEYVFR